MVGQKNCQYTSLSSKFNFEMYFYDVEYIIYDSSYDF